MLITSSILRLRHLFYDKGWLKSVTPDVPTVCIGNVSVGGTGKTPMTELVIRTLQEGNVESADAEIYGFEGSLFAPQPINIAVLSRGYKRKTKGFQQVIATGTASQFGDEPLQIKRKFPDVTVAVDADRVEGCELLVNPRKLKELKNPEAVLDARFPHAEFIILDDAFQHRRIKATKNIVLTTYARPFFKDRLMPLGRLRDLRSRVKEADMVIVTKCPPYIDEWEKSRWAERMGMRLFDVNTCTGVLPDGRKQILLFATTQYEPLKAVFPEGDPRYVHAKMAILFSGIANDTPLEQWLSESYKIVDHFEFPDHHFFSDRDMARIDDAARYTPTSVVITTEKDAQRMRDSLSEDKISSLKVSDDLRRRTFYAPIRTVMLTANEQNVFKDFLTALK